MSIGCKHLGSIFVSISASCEPWPPRALTVTGFFYDCYFYFLCMFIYKHWPSLSIFDWSINPFVAFQVNRISSLYISCFLKRLFYYFFFFLFWLNWRFFFFLWFKGRFNYLIRKKRFSLGRKIFRVIFVVIWSYVKFIKKMMYRLRRMLRWFKINVYIRCRLKVIVIND